ncbi:MAG: divergent PAP2 family protein [Candidatus Woesearchaeota archaeon]
MIFDDITNYYFWSIFTAWAISCILKTIIYSVKTKKLDLMAGFKNGGMPSSHSAIMGAVTFSIFFEQGLTPILFLSIAISALVIRDAVTVRQEVGLIGEALNNLLKEKNIKELDVIYGHTLKQVIAGLIISLISTGFFYYIL